MNKRILFVVTLPPPVHGAALMNQFLFSSGLINSQFDCSFLPLIFSNSINDIGAFSIRKIWKMLIFSIKLVKRLIKFKPQVVYFTIAPVGAAFYRDAFFSLLMKMFNVRILYHLHGKGIYDSSRSYFRRAIYKGVFRNTDTIVLAASLAKDISKVYRGKPFILANGLPKFVCEESKTVSDPPTILFLSNLVRTKGVEIFLECIKQLHESGIHFRAKIIGAPYDISFNEVESFIKKNSLQSKIELLGALYGVEKEKALIKSDILLFPSFYQNEAFPITILEAMQAGVPVIASNNGAIAEIIEDGKTGFIVPMRNVTAFKEKTELLLKNSQLRTQMAIAGKERYNQLYTIEVFEHNIVKIFRQVLK
jgi:glycosyltransferase involved in cell wall biosynthesis